MLLSRLVTVAAVGVLMAVGSLAGDAAAAAPIGLGTADSFAVLGGTTVTSTGQSPVKRRAAPGRRPTRHANERDVA